MDDALASLTRAQEELRSNLALGFQEIRAASDGIARERASEAKRWASEREGHRTRAEAAEAERERLETKLLQCEEALKETKNALLETRDQAKDVRARARGRISKRARRGRGGWEGVFVCVLGVSRVLGVWEA